MTGSTLRSTGDKIDVDLSQKVFVHGAFNLGPIYEYKEVETAGFEPGMGVDPVAVAAGCEDNVTIMGDASLVVLGVAEIDFGQLTLCSEAYSVADDAPIIFFHWNPGALLRNVKIVDAAADIQPGELMGTTSGTPGRFKDDTTTAVCLRSYKFVADPGADAEIVAFIHGFL